MLRIVLLCLVSVSVWQYSAAKGKCVLPKPQKIDWNRLPGEWFNILNRNTKGDKLVKCLQLRNFKYTNKGFSYVIEDYHLNKGTYEGVTSNFVLNKSGTYKKFDKIVDTLNWVKIIKKDSSQHKISKPVKKELVAMTKASIGFMTDYKNYIMDFRCGENGEKMLWIMSKNPYPDAEDILRITNKLNEIGRGWNSFPLYLSGCSSTYGIKYFQRI